jgi:4-diphosphocytidyl-2-C-methyl-D-erythritol kinase
VSLRALHDLPAPAKLNLFLHVTGRRADGYHLLESVFVLIDWCDTLHFERRDDGRLCRHDLGAPLPAEDLCLRAARALQAAGGVAWGADIWIDKRVPSGAGMGGGSSDAATVLLALNRLWGLRWPRARLLEIAATLGADVPFFVHGHDALAQGVGEKLTAVALPGPRAYAVVKPPGSIATADIFGSTLLRRDSPSVIVEGSLESSALTALASPAGFFGRNDLQSPAEARCQEVAQVAEWLRVRFGNSRMTGSGSAVFSKLDAGVLPEATQLEGSCPEGWVVRLCRGLVRHPLADWAE